LEAEFFTRFNGWKRLEDYSPSGEDNLIQATAFGMPSWATINFRAQYHINKYVGINFAVENIMDINYRHFASGVSAPGRNFIIAVRGHF
jgi:hemoglobin/transferrin/lactoferrin receptor protein